MLGIFKDKRRGLAPIANNPFRTGRIFPTATVVVTTSQTACVDPATRRHLLLTAGKTRSRHNDILELNRP